MVTEPVKCYTNNRVHIELDLDGGTHSMSGFDMDRNSSLKTVLYKIGDPTKNGYKFMGWRYDRLMPPMTIMVDFPAYEDRQLTATWLPAGAELIGDSPISDEYKLGKIMQYESWSEGSYLTDYCDFIGNYVYKLCRKESDGSLAVTLYNMALFNFGTIKVQPYTSSGNGYRYSFQYSSEMEAWQAMSSPNTKYMFYSRGTSVSRSTPKGPFTPSAENWVDFRIPDRFSNDINSKTYAKDFDLAEWVFITDITELTKDGIGSIGMPIDWTMGSTSTEINGVVKKNPRQIGQTYPQKGLYCSFDYDIQMTMKEGLLRKFKALT